LRTLIQHWLLCFSDPSGLCEPLPEGPLPKGALGQLCQIAENHSVLPAFTANFTSAVAAYGTARITHDGESEINAAMGPAESQLRRRIAYSLVLRRQADEIMQVLSRQSIPAIVLKGADFADRLYQPSALRYFTDVDLLVPREALDEIGQILEGLGYQRRKARRKHNETYGQETWQPGRQPGGNVEIHWNLVNSPTIRRGVSVTFEDLQMEPLSKSGEPPLPTAAALLLIAAVHAAGSHAFDRLALLHDIRQICRGLAGPIDTIYLAEAARQTGAGASLEMALHLGGTLLNEPVCAELEQRLRLRGYGLMKTLISPAMVLRQRGGLDLLRRKIFRELLKRP